MGRDFRTAQKSQMLLMAQLICLCIVIRACIWSKKCRINAEWSPDVERWESDEDGEERSDEEDGHALRLEAWVGAGSAHVCVESGAGSVLCVCRFSDYFVLSCVIDR